MKEDNIRKLLEILIRDSEGNYNRKILGLRSTDEYLVEKESLIEDVINQIINQDIIDEINNLKRKLR